MKVMVRPTTWNYVYIWLCDNNIKWGVRIICEGYLYEFELDDFDGNLLKIAHPEFF